MVKNFMKLISKEEMFRAKNQGKFYVIPPEYKDINYSKYFLREVQNQKFQWIQFIKYRKIKSRSGN